MDKSIVSLFLDSRCICIRYEIAWSMKWRVPDQEVDQRKLGEKLWKRLSGIGLNREDAMDRSRWVKQKRDD